MFNTPRFNVYVCLLTKLVNEMCIFVFKLYVAYIIKKPVTF